MYEATYVYAYIMQVTVLHTLTHTVRTLYTALCVYIKWLEVMDFMHITWVDD